MKRLLIMFALLVPPFADVRAAGPTDIVAEQGRSVVYLEVADDKGGVVARGSGFVASHDGHVVTVAHIKAMPGQKAWAVVGQRSGTKYPLSFIGTDEAADVALWKLPKSTTCRPSVTLTRRPVQVLERALVLGFPGNDDLTPALVSVANVSTPRGYYKTDGFLRAGNSGGPVFDESGKVFGIVQGGTLPGTENNDLIPIGPALDLLQKWGVAVSLETPRPFDNACYSACRHDSHGVERWTSEVPWEKATGWMGGGHNPTDECKALIAAELAGRRGAEIGLLPGEGEAGRTGKWDEGRWRDVRRREYRYFCKGTLRSGPVYALRASPACTLWQ